MSLDSSDTPSETHFQNWVTYVNAAVTPEELVRVVQAFVESLPPPDLALVSSDCHATQITTKEDVARCAVSIATQELMSSSLLDPAENARLRRISAIFVEATRRLGALSLESRFLKAAAGIAGGLGDGTGNGANNA